MSALISKWLQNESYDEGIELVELYAPTHEMLDILKNGPSAINCLYLRQAVEGLVIAKPLPRVRVIKEKLSGPKELYAKLRALQAQKAKRRNQFFSVNTDEARATISDDLIDFRKEIHELCRQIEFYEEKGELIIIPESVTNEEVIETEDLFELQKMLTNTRSNLTKNKKKLSAAYAERDKTKINKYKPKVESLTTKKELLESKIKHIREKKSTAV